MNALRHVTFAAGMGLASVDAGGAEPTGWQALADERAVIRIADAIDRAVDAQDWKHEYAYVVSDLRRLLIVSAILFAAIILAGLFI